MYRIKSTPEDFIVKEISDINPEESGQYCICLLKKTNYSTIRAVEQLAKSLGKKTKDIGFAGTKDKKAITEQYISIRHIPKEKIEHLHLKDIQLRFLGYRHKPVSLGELTGNEFIITIRNLEESDIEKIKNKPDRLLMPNYFGEQRFSKNNIEIGRKIIKAQYEEAVNLTIQSGSDYKDKMLSKDPVAALRCIPKKLLLMYIHAYQSYLWNKTLTEYMKDNKENIMIPIIGFGIELNGQGGEIIRVIMQKEKISFRDFIIKKIPELSSEGSERNAFVEIKKLKIMEIKGNTLKLTFSLQKGSYATVAVAFLLDSLNTFLKDFI